MDREDRKEINIPKTVGYLNRAFADTTRGMGKAVRSTELYDLQNEFSYMIDGITRGPNYIVPKAIQQCNEFITKIKRNRKQETEPSKKQEMEPSIA